MMQPSRDVLLKTKTKNTFFFQEILTLFSLKTVKYCNYFCKARHGSVAQVCKVFLFLFYSFRHVLTGFIIIQLLCECNIFYLIVFELSKIYRNLKLDCDPVTFIEYLLLFMTFFHLKFLKISVLRKGKEGVGTKEKSFIPLAEVFHR